MLTQTGTATATATEMATVQKPAFDEEMELLQKNLADLRETTKLLLDRLQKVVRLEKSVEAAEVDPPEQTLPSLIASVRSARQEIQKIHLELGETLRGLEI